MKLLKVGIVYPNEALDITLKKEGVIGVMRCFNYGKTYSLFW